MISLSEIHTTKGSCLVQGPLRWLIWLSLLIPAAGHAQNTYDESWKWVQFTTADGLPSNTIWTITQARSGLWWTITPGGIAYYDGYRWDRIDTAEGLPDSQYHDLAPGIGDSIIISATSKLYMGTSNGFRLISDSVESSAPLSPTTFLLIMKGRIFQYHKGLIEPFVDSACTATGRCVMFFGPRTVSPWLISANGLYRLQNNRWEPIIYGKQIPQIMEIAENNAGKAMIVINGPVAMRGVWEWSQGNPLKRIPLPGRDMALTLDIAPNNDVVIINFSGAMWLYRNSKLTPLQYIQSQRRMNSSGVKFTSTGDLWVASQQGLYYYRSKYECWSFLGRGNFDPRDRIHDIVLRKNGELWLATADGIDILRPDGSRRSIESIKGTVLNEVTGMAEDTGGRMWISSGSGFSGVYCFDGADWKYYALGPAGAPVFIHKIAKDSRGTLWMLGIGISNGYIPASEPGVYRFSAGVFTHWDRTVDPLLTRMYAFAEGRDGALWFGSYDGIACYRNGAWHDYPGDRYHWNGIFSLAVDSTGTVWFADRRMGLMNFDTAGHYHVFTSTDGLSNNIVQSIVVGADNTLWIGTMAGLCHYAHGTWARFDEHSGLLHSFIWPIMVTDTLVYAGTNGGGVAVLHLKSVSPPPRIEIALPAIEERHVYITWHSMAFWKELPTGELQSRYRLNDEDWSHWSRMEDINFYNLKPGSYRFQVQAKGLFGNFDTTGETMTFSIVPPFYLYPGFFLPLGGSVILALVLGIRSYRRKRLHDRQIRVSEAKFRRLTEATFEGILLHEKGIILDANKSLHDIFRFQPGELIGKPVLRLFIPDDRARVEAQIHGDGDEHPFETSGLRSDGSRVDLEVITKSLSTEASVIHVAAIRDITDRKLAEQQLLEYQEKLRSLAIDLSITEERERRHMAAYLHDSIGQTLAFCRIKLGMLQETVPGSSDHKDWKELRQTLDQIILDMRSLTFELSPPLLQELTIFEALEWLVEKLSSQFSIKIRLEGAKPSHRLPVDLRALVFRSIRELIINACKHSHGTLVIVRAEEHDGVYTLTVEDNGNGFDPESGTVKKTQGFGLFSIRERLQYLDGSLTIKSQSGRGTRASVSIPLQKRGLAEKSS